MELPARIPASTSNRPTAAGKIATCQWSAAGSPILFLFCRDTSRISEPLMLRGSPHLEELAVCGSGRIDEQLAAESERAEFVFEAEAFELEGGANRQKDMVALGSQRSRGRLC